MSMKTISDDAVYEYLNETASITYVKNFLTRAEADDLFAFCQTLTPVREKNKRNANVLIRKLHYGTYLHLNAAAASQTQTSYGKPFDILTAPPIIKWLAAKLTTFAGDQSKPVNYLSILGYANEKDHINQHQHKEDRKHKDQSVFVVSLGQVRPLAIGPVDRVVENGQEKFLWPHDESRFEFVYPAHGSLYILPSWFNVNPGGRTHGIPDQDFKCSLRISINCKRIPVEPPPPEKPKKSKKPFIRKPGTPRIYDQHEGKQHPADAVNRQGDNGTWYLSEGNTVAITPEQQKAKRSAAAKKAATTRAAKKAAALPPPTQTATTLGECELCCDGTLATEVVGVSFFNDDGYKYCAKHADLHRKDDRRRLMRQMSVGKVMGQFYNLKMLADLGGKPMDFGDGDVRTYPTVADYIARVKKKFLGTKDHHGNYIYDLAVVVEHIARLEKRMETK